MDLNDKTRIQLWSVLVAVPFLVGGVMWLTTMYSSTVEAQKTNDRQDIKLEAQLSLLLDIRDRVIRIETKLPQKGN